MIIIKYFTQVDTALHAVHVNTLQWILKHVTKHA